MISLLLLAFIIAAFLGASALLALCLEWCSRADTDPNVLCED